MKKILIASVALILAACQPKQYTGPLDSPAGNWKSSHSQYYFNSENVGEDDQCEYSVISFYKDSLCCIEGVKGAFVWRLSGDSLYVDSLIWSVKTLKGNELTLSLIGKIIPPDNSSGTADDEVSDAPESYKDITIQYDSRGFHYYTDNEGDLILCWPKIQKTEETTDTLFWYDTRTDTYIPL